MGYKLLVFDWDGTLMDSQARIISSMQAAIAEMDAELRSDAQIRNIIGLGLNEAIKRLFPEADLPFIHEMVSHYRQQYLLSNTTPTPLYDGVPELLEELLAKDYWLAVATSKGNEGLRKAIHESGLHGVFHATRTAEQTCSKPDPQMLLEIMQELDFAPADTLMIGDTEYDLQMAHAAKTASLGVAHGAHEAERLHALRPSGVVKDIEALASWLRQYA